VRHQNSQTRQEKKDQTRDQNLTKPQRRYEHHSSVRRRARPSNEDPLSHLRTRQQSRF